MKFSRWTVVGMVVVGLLFLASVGLLLVPQLFQTSKTATAVDEKHCPVCGRELPMWAQKAGECPFCKAEGRDPDIKQYREGGSRALRLGIPIALVCCFVILLGTHILLLVRARVVKNPVEIIYNMYCKQCHRKLRYREKQIGKLGRCPMCGKPIIFPKPHTLGPETRWGKMKRWLKIGSR
jgi:rRNA maturation protein Nop10